MARKNSGKETAQLGFNMGIMLPKSKPAPEPASESIYQPESDVAAPAELKGTEILTVCELTHRISDLLEEGIGMVWVEGEISNLRHQSSGHRYFTLKDETAQLSCVLFARTAAGRANVELRDGLKVQLYGQISVYQPRGQYQLMVRLVRGKESSRPALRNSNDVLLPRGSSIRDERSRCPVFQGASVLSPPRPVQPSGTF